MSNLLHTVIDNNLDVAELVSFLDWLNARNIDLNRLDYHPSKIWFNTFRELNKFDNKSTEAIEQLRNHLSSIMENKENVLATNS